MWLWGKKCREKREKSPLILPDRFVFLRCQKVVNCGFFLPQIRTQSPYIFDRKKCLFSTFSPFLREFYGKGRNVRFSLPTTPRDINSIARRLSISQPPAKKKRKIPFILFRNSNLFRCSREECADFFFFFRTEGMNGDDDFSPKRRDKIEKYSQSRCSKINKK